MAELVELHTDKNKFKITSQKKKHKYILLPSFKTESGTSPLSMLPLKNLFKATHISISYALENDVSEVKHCVVTILSTGRR